ncbi:MAG: hypothetical protein P1P90_03210 [Patescibacteria group bacterium]|nr:hypothetical protein [Patescibacteria group bacterium]
MLKPAEAKSSFMSSLGLLLIVVAWPLFSGILAGVLAAIGFESLELVALALAILWLGLFVWLVVKLWKIAPEVGVTPWAFLWIFLPMAGIFIIGMLFLEPLKYIADNKPAGERLPLTWSLLKESWDLFTKNIKTITKTSIYFLYIFLAVGVYSALSVLWSPLSLIAFFVILAAMMAFAWVMIKLIFVMNRLDDGQSLKGDEQQLASGKFWSSIWVMLLSFFISTGPLVALGVIAFLFLLASFLPFIGGTGAELTDMVQVLQDNLGVLIGGGSIFAVLFIASWIWMIYKSIQYSQALYTLLIDGKFSMESLKESVRIVKQRWWGVLWKNQLLSTVTAIMSYVMMFIAGILLLIPIFLFKNSAYEDSISELLNQLLTGLIYMVIMPYTLMFGIKFYKALKKSAK